MTRPPHSQRFEAVRAWWKKASRGEREKYLAHTAHEHPPHWASLSFGRLQSAIYARAMERAEIRRERTDAAASP